MGMNGICRTRATVEGERADIHSSFWQASCISVLAEKTFYE